MKKTLALMLALVLLSACAPALAADQYGAWTIRLTDIVVTAEGETFEAVPSLTLQAGFTEDYAKGWLAVELAEDGGVLASFVAEEDEGGTPRCAFEAGGSRGLAKAGFPLYELAADWLGMARDERPDSLPAALEMLDAFLSMPKGVEYLFSHLGSVKKQGDGRYAVSVDLPGGRLRGTLSWRWERRARKPFDLNDWDDADRFELRAQASRGALIVDDPDGFSEALEEAFMQDEALAELAIALMLLAGE